MNVETIALWESTLERLSSEDEAIAQAAVRRREALERELERVRVEEDLAVRSADLSRVALESTSKWLARVRATDPSVPGTSAMAERAAGAGSKAPVPPPVREIVRLFIQERGEATTRQIIEHVQRVRPDVNAEGSTPPELTGMVKEKVLVRPALGSYRIAPLENAVIRS
ncbi:hypothetical protein [Streptomyces sp. NPDC058548]|uniref:hypothetical protein n=1 Tax=Streptomyces sp. NPDC058548 TaxID=3346545 RepID=UPI003647AB4F